MKNKKYLVPQELLAAINDMLLNASPEFIQPTDNVVWIIKDKTISKVISLWVTHIQEDWVQMP